MPDVDTHMDSGASGDTKVDNDTLVTIYVTAPNREEALQISSSLVRDRLVACANILPQIQSVYMYGGDMQLDTEVAILLKTTAARVDAVKAEVIARHSYDIPCITVWPVIDGSEAYAHWVAEHVQNTAPAVSGS